MSFQPIKDETTPDSNPSAAAESSSTKETDSYTTVDPNTDTRHGLWYQCIARYSHMICWIELSLLTSCKRGRFHISHM